MIASSGGFLIKPGIGLMIWTLIVFGGTMLLLSKLAFPRITEALGKRQKAIEDSIDTAERTRKEADEILAEYRERLKEARAQADEIVQRARQSADVHEQEAKGRGQELIAEAAQRAEREHRGGHRAGDLGHPPRGRRPDGPGDREGHQQDPHRRRPAPARRGGARRARLLLDLRGTLEQLMEELAQVYARSLFEVGREQGKLDVLREQLGQFADALDQNRELAMFFFSPYFSTKEKQDGLDRMLVDADESFVNFLDLLIENHRMPVIFRIRQEYERLWDEENRVLPVEITSAIELDQATTENLGRTIGERAGPQGQLAARVDPDILGGIVVRVGNSILDASIRNRLEQLRRQVAQGAS